MYLIQLYMGIKIFLVCYDAIEVKQLPVSPNAVRLATEVSITMMADE